MRGTLPPVEGVGVRQSRKLWQLLKQAKDTKGHLNTFGMLDPVQVTQAAKYLSTAYVSGWQCSSTASTSNEPGPDFADYPMDTVPNKVDHLSGHNCSTTGNKKVAGHRCPNKSAHHAAGGLSQPRHRGRTYRLWRHDVGYETDKMMIQSGAAGMHIEDQRSGSKKCGHMAGKVLTSTAEHIDGCARLDCRRM